MTTVYLPSSRNNVQRAFFLKKTFVRFFEKTLCTFFLLGTGGDYSILTFKGGAVPAVYVTRTSAQ